jgi:hypothetical protein
MNRIQIWPFGSYQSVGNNERDSELLELSLPKETVTPSIKLGELPPDIRGIIIQYQSIETVCVFGQTGLSFRDATKPIISKLIEYIKLIKENAQNIQNIEVNSNVPIGDYFFLAKQAVASDSSDQNRQRPYAIKHIKLDKNGVTGLKPYQFKTVAQTAMEGNDQCIVNIRECLSKSNYNQPEKDKILTDVNKLFHKQASFNGFGYLTQQFFQFRW